MPPNSHLENKLLTSELSSSGRGFKTPSGYMIGWGTTLGEVDGVAVQGWADGAEFFVLDGTGLRYVNDGTSTTATWKLIPHMATPNTWTDTNTFNGTTIFGGSVLRGSDATQPIAIPDAATYTVLAANSGKVHIIPNLTADIVITLPNPSLSVGYYEFWSGGVAADAQDWQFDTGSDTYFYLGGLMQITSGTVASTLQVPNGTSNSKMNILTPEPGTLIKLYADGTNWYINGTVLSNTTDAVTWAGQ